MEGRDEALIGRYLAHEASAEEIREVEERRENDKGFRQMLTDSELAFQALRLHQREELRNRFRKRDEILDKVQVKITHGIESPHGFGHRLFRAWLTDLDVDSEFKTINIPAPAHLQDATSTSKQKPIARDTVLQQARQSEQTQQVEEKVSQKETKPIAQNAQKGDKLFAAYFSPYVDEMMDPAVRGDDELSPLEKFQLAYWEKRYADATTEFAEISETMRQNDNIRFMYANALIAEGRIQHALPTLESIVQNNRSRYTTESLYVLALGYCKAGDLKNGLRYIERYLQEEHATRKEQALKIVQELK